MKVNSINTFNYSNTNNKTRPVFKQDASSSIARQAIVDQFIESANKKDIATSNPIKVAANKFSFLTNIFRSKDNEDKAEKLKKTLDSFDYDSVQNILYKI